MSKIQLKNDVENKQLRPNTEPVTLEQVVRDMVHVFNDLKNGISLMKKTHQTKESVYNIEKELEIIYKRQENMRKLEEAKKKDKENKEGSKQKIKTSNKKTINSKSLHPASEPQNKNITVTNIQFPRDFNRNKFNENATITSAKTSLTNKPRKPSVKTRKTIPVPPPRDIYNPLGMIKDEVEKAIRERKTFTIKGQYPAVRRALLKRGWIEKYHSSYRSRLNDDIRGFLTLNVTDLVDLLRNKSVSDTVKKIIKSKLLRDHQVDLYWDHTFDVFKECNDAKKLTLINRFRREPFSYTSKQGLCQASRDAHWLQIPGVAQINHPRCYILVKGGDTKSFLKDFGLTAAISLLKLVVKNNITGESKIVSETGKISMKVFDFAVSECYKFIKIVKHKDIDEEIRDALEVEWNNFLCQFYKTVHIGNHFKLSDKNVDPSQEAEEMVRKANYLLNQLRKHMPSLDMDGYMNIWILKPTNSSRGEGIHICRTLQYILDVVKKNPNRRYVIQKYIERPFLIHDTKFDIRQWFLVSSAYPLTIWIYKLCYLRFSSQTYNLRKLHESIHLTNNSVQAKYLQQGTRDPLLPSHGMWDSTQFKNFLSDIGYPDIFGTVIYPGMKQCITGAMIAHRDKMDNRKNCFEIYGADFMISETFEPWLLEINSNPALHASTPVTARLCPEVLEDVIKVVVDHARNPQASTGNFELCYMEKDNIQCKINEKFQVMGNPLPENYFCNITEEEMEPITVPNKFEPSDPGKHLLQTGQIMKDALLNLLEIVKQEKVRRKAKKEKAIDTNLVMRDSFNQTQTDVISLFESLTISKMDSEYSAKIVELDSEEPLATEESRKIEQVLEEIRSPQNKKQVLSGLIKVMETLKQAARDADDSQ